MKKNKHVEQLFYFVTRKDPSDLNSSEGTEKIAHSAHRAHRAHRTRPTKLFNKKANILKKSPIAPIAK
jgi:hypothetical protein